MPGNPLVRFDEGRVGRTAGCRLLSYSTASAVDENVGQSPRGSYAKTYPKIFEILKAEAFSFQRSAFSF
jgi:hypothetical protein